jgi:hypothetical protein
MIAHPLALQLRNQQSLVEMGVDKNTTVVFPAPLMSTIQELGSFISRERAASNLIRLRPARQAAHGRRILRGPGRRFHERQRRSPAQASFAFFYHTPRQMLRGAHSLSRLRMNTRRVAEVPFHPIETSGP